MSTFATTLEQLKAKFVGLSSRERGLILVASIAVGCMGLYQIYEPVNALFLSQNQRISSLEENVKALGPSLERYAKLRARKDIIEQEYREVEFKEGALSHLENLVKSKAGISTGFTIKDSPPKEFGGDYEQTSFSIKFTTSNLPSLIEFLRELAYGTRPMILGRLDIQRSRFAERLEVDLEVSSIRRARPA
jgi:hypothetical protein